MDTILKTMFTHLYGEECSVMGVGKGFKVFHDILVLKMNGWELRSVKFSKDLACLPKSLSHGTIKI